MDRNQLEEARRVLEEQANSAATSIELEDVIDFIIDDMERFLYATGNSHLANGLLFLEKAMYGDILNDDTRTKVEHLRLLNALLLEFVEGSNFHADIWAEIYLRQVVLNSKNDDLIVPPSLALDIQQSLMRLIEQSCE